MDGGSEEDVGGDDGCVVSVDINGPVGVEGVQSSVVSHTFGTFVPLSLQNLYADIIKE